MFSTPFIARRDHRAAHPCFQPKLETLEERVAPAGYSLTPCPERPTTASHQS